MPALKICICSAEIMPFAKTGGLADVVGALSVELSAAGHEILAFMPLYAAVGRNHPGSEPVQGLQNVDVTIGSRTFAFSVRIAPIPGTSVKVHLIDCPEFFGRPEIYTLDPDEHRRFVLFTRAVLESCLRIGFAPDVFHCHDWHTGFLPLFLRTVYAAVPQFARSRSVFTIHNIGYQGVMPSAFVADLGLTSPAAHLDPGDLASGWVNSLKTALKIADIVTTVSPTYAREITETSLGMGMEATLRARGSPVIGILNGVDYQYWDPRHDRYLKNHFSPDDLEGKRINKAQLIDRTGLAVGLDTPLVGMVTRLASQKGIDLLIEALPRVLEQRDSALVVLGSGEERYSAFFDSLSRRFARRVAFVSAHDEPLAHLIEAGSDLFLMPSQYEPCGLNQMYSLRYGTIPVVRRTGGLADSVRHFEPMTGEGTGCVFNDYDAPAVVWALNTALDWFAQPPLWERLVQNAMREDFSWSRQIAQYVAVFRGASAARDFQGESKA